MKKKDIIILLNRRIKLNADVWSEADRDNNAWEMARRNARMDELYYIKKLLQDNGGHRK